MCLKNSVIAFAGTPATRTIQICWIGVACEVSRMRTPFCWIRHCHRHSWFESASHLMVETKETNVNILTVGANWKTINRQFQAM